MQDKAAKTIDRVKTISLLKNFIVFRIIDWNPSLL